MKITVIISIIIVFIGISSDFCYGQYIIAGAVFEDDIYYDVVPDDTLLTRISNHTPYIGGNVQLDIDQNGSDDFTFIAYAYGSLGGGGSYCILGALDANKILSRTDTVLGYPPGTEYIVDIPQILSYNDSIFYSSDFNNQSCYLWSGATGFESRPQINCFDNIGDFYIGISLNINNNIFIGWIRVNVSFIDYMHKLSIKDFAYNSTATYVTDTDNTFNINIYPNPVNDKLIITHQKKSIKAFNVTLSSLSGQIILQRTFTGSTSSLSLNNLKAGIYILRIKTDNTIIIKKIIKL